MGGRQWRFWCDNTSVIFVALDSQKTGADVLVSVLAEDESLEQLVIILLSIYVTGPLYRFGGFIPSLLSRLIISVREFR